MEPSQSNNSTQSSQPNRNSRTSNGVGPLSSLTTQAGERSAGMGSLVLVANGMQSPRHSRNSGRDDPLLSPRSSACEDPLLSPRSADGCGSNGLYKEFSDI